MQGDGIFYGKEHEEAFSKKTLVRSAGSIKIVAQRRF
jgi:hypothetical protein